MLRELPTVSRMLSIAIILLIAVSIPAAAAIVFNQFTDPHPVVSGGTISISFAGDKFIGSAQGDGMGNLYSTNPTGGNVQIFAPNVSLAPSNAGEHFVASSLGLGGFPSRDVYVAASNTVVHITHDGNSSNTFVSGLVGDVRGILFDPVGTFGNDMLVTTLAGRVYRVNSAGVATPLASLGEDTEGLDVIPLGAGFGGFDGRLLVASENSGLLRAIDTSGNVTVINPNNPIAGAEMVSLVPLNLGQSGNQLEGFYAANYTPNVIKADANQFAGFQGDAIVTGETTHLVTRIHWNGSAFTFTNVGQFPNQPEDGIFVTTTHINPTPTVPESNSIMLSLMGLSGIAPVLRRLRRR